MTFLHFTYVPHAHEVHNTNYNYFTDSPATAFFAHLPHVFKNWESKGKLCIEKKGIDELSGKSKRDSLLNPKNKVSCFSCAYTIIRPGSVSLKLSTVFILNCLLTALWLSVFYDSMHTSVRFLLRSWFCQNLPTFAKIQTYLRYAMHALRYFSLCYAWNKACGK